MDGGTNLVDLFRELNQFDFAVLNQPANRNRRSSGGISTLITPLAACVVTMFIVCSVLRARQTVKTRRALRARDSRDEYII